MNYLYEHLGSRPQTQLWVGNGRAGYKSDGMGCDIHAWCEYRESESAPWQLLKEVSCNQCLGTGKLERVQHDDDDRPKDEKKLEECFWCDGQGKTVFEFVREGEGEDAYEYWHGANCYRGRNYSLFSILNDAVRNYSGYEGLYPERGIPEDASEEYKNLSEGPDWHSHSWLDVDELTAAIVHGEHYFSHLPDSDGYVVTGWFVKGTLEHIMRPLAEKHGNKNVRMVFFFDN